MRIAGDGVHGRRLRGLIVVLWRAGLRIDEALALREATSIAGAARAGVRRRFAPHQLRHAHAVEMAREGVALIVIRRQLGHSNLGITSVCLQGIDNAEIIETVHARGAPMVPVTTSRPDLPGTRH
jgi:site-specific recombinase XerD